MPNKYYKEIIGERQMYRRIANAVTETVKQINLQSHNSDSTDNASAVNYDQFSSDSDDITLSESCSNNQVINNLGQNINQHVSLLTSENEDIQIDKSENDLDSNKDCDLIDLLRQWSIRNKVSHTSFTDLLHILSKYHPELPLDSRTVMKTPSNFVMKQLNTGQYCHFGLSNPLVKYVQENYSSFNEDKIVKVSFNIDGIPLYRSNNIQFWPILGLIKNPSIITSPFVVGIFCGSSKPDPLNSFLEDFVTEMSNLLQDGFSFNGLRFKVEIHSFVCDAPARAFIKCTKSHSGYSACDKCTEKGEYYNGRVIMKGISAEKRTDKSFATQTDANHHIGISPLIKLNVGLISLFPIDYMHAVCLGVMRKLLISWTSGSLHIRLKRRVVLNISNSLESLRAFVPFDFNRKPRSFSELLRWKATEFRSFLLYFGPVILKSYVDIAIYEHFMLLHCSITILISKNHIKHLGCTLANDLLKIFVSHCEKIYGKEYTIYNVHVLLHLAEDVCSFGPLDEISSFPFENYLGQLKKLVRSPTKPLEQACRRLVEINLSPRDNFTQKLSFDCQLCGEHEDGPLLPLLFACKQFKQVVFNGFKLSGQKYSKSNSYCITKEEKVIQIHNIISIGSDINIVGMEFLSYDSLYTYPIDSKELCIFTVSNLSALRSWPLNVVSGKCMLLHLPNSADTFVSFPLLHTI